MANDPILITNVHVTVSMEPNDSFCGFVQRHMGDELWVHVFQRPVVGEFTLWQAVMG